jgi:hypothetical protein
MWTMYPSSTGHVFHLVNSIDPSTLNVHLLFTFPSFEFIVVNFHEIHYQMSQMLSELGPYISL